MCYELLCTAYFDYHLLAVGQEYDRQLRRTPQLPRVNRPFSQGKSSGRPSSLIWILKERQSLPTNSPL